VKCANVQSVLDPMPDDDVLVGRVMELRKRVDSLNSDLETITNEAREAYERGKEFERAGDHREARRYFDLASQRKADKKRVGIELANELRRYFRCRPSKRRIRKDDRARFRAEFGQCFIVAAAKTLPPELFELVKLIAKQWHKPPADTRDATGREMGE
jgi:hypothetical protein